MTVTYRLPALRSPLQTSVDQSALLQELARCATRAANGHNTQPWCFRLLPDQLRDAAFMKELKSWIRFSDAQAAATHDGLFTRTSGNGTVPPWLGRLLFGALFREKSENEKYATHLRSSAGVAMLVGERADPACWFEVVAPTSASHLPQWPLAFATR